MRTKIFLKRGTDCAVRCFSYKAVKCLAILVAAIVAGSATLLMAHPLGNFSANHYMRFEASPRGIEMRYVMDLAEIPTFELLREWGLDRNTPPAELQRKANEQARIWMRNLSLKVDGKQVQPILEGTDFVIADGAGNLPILRITAAMTLTATPGRLEYEDHNYEGRAGWKEIVIASSRTQLMNPSQGDRDRSHALTAYPPDPMVAPPQDLRAEFAWSPAAPDVTAPVATSTPIATGAFIGTDALIVSDARNAQAATPAKNSTPAQIATPAIKPIPQPASKPALPSSAATPANAPAGAVIKNDFLSRTLHSKDIPLNILFAALIVAFGLGAAHALTPGHGKTIVASYLVGSRGTIKHAAFLGLIVTATHTITVFALGLATLFLFRFIVPEKITEILGVISGLSIAVIGAGMLWKRVKAQRHRHQQHHEHPHAHDHHHPHVHDHSHPHERPHDHVHPHPHPHSHAHDPSHGEIHDKAHDHDHGHHHGPGGHTHVPEGEITWASLTTLAVSGGLVPCESALVLLLGAIALGRIGLGLLLLISFSLGLAGVLMAIGAIVLYAKRALPKRSQRGGWTKWTRWTPIASAGLVALLGVVMTGVSLGWLPSRWLVG
jgi:nickel/cobalt transporter (NicO) family protein